MASVGATSRGRVEKSLDTITAEVQCSILSTLFSHDVRRHAPVQSIGNPLCKGTRSILPTINVVGDYPSHCERESLIVPLWFDFGEFDSAVDAIFPIPIFRIHRYIT